MKLPETRGFVLEDNHDFRLHMSEKSKFEIVDNLEIDYSKKFGKYNK